MNNQVTYDKCSLNVLISDDIPNLNIVVDFRASAVPCFKGPYIY